MHPVKIEWISFNNGGRKTIPSLGRYYSIARFPDDITWPDNAWSVMFELTDQENKYEKTISSGFVNFLFETAPQEKLSQNEHFEIYEGSKKVAEVFLIRDHRTND